ncbi:hypothetical protein R50073_39070 [Maricurvus nonylphenolicus]|uniref:outer membrane beta-barrel domain-containing protein n=1 Tax=Maricurvus nonylphenolicus TaxID=1008307 RepID=UPI0036F35E33
METGLQRIFLTCSAGLLISFANPVSADSENDRSVLDKIITPDLERREITEADLDTEDFEIGAYYGVMNVEDFGTNDVTGFRLAYHVTEDLFVEATYGSTTTQETSFERLSGATQILTDDQRDLTYYNLSAGYNLFPGEIFIGNKWSFNSALYITAGVGNTDFADEEHFTYTLGAGLRLLTTDWLALHFDVRGHMFDHDLLGEEQTIINLETHAGITFFF